MAKKGTKKLKRRATAYQICSCSPDVGDCPRCHQSKTICYTGIGAKKNRNHSPKEFLRAVKKGMKKVCKLTHKCPRSNNLKGWVKYSGAEYGKCQ